MGEDEEGTLATLKAIRRGFMPRSPHALDPIRIGANQRVTLVDEYGLVPSPSVRTGKAKWRQYPQ
jgi:hypothetical protein